MHSRHTDMLKICSVKWFIERVCQSGLANWLPGRNAYMQVAIVHVHCTVVPYHSRVCFVLAPSNISHACEVCCGYQCIGLNGVFILSYLFDSQELASITHFAL